MRALVLLFLILIAPPLAAARCGHALVLALDVSGSVNETEYYQQINGLASALSDADVRALILAQSAAPVHLAVFEWSSRNHQFVIQPWIALDNAPAIDAAAANIRRYSRQRAGLKTAIGTALAFAERLLAQRPDCWHRTVDISGDGSNNIGPTPGQLYARPDFDRITVNALVVGAPGPDGDSPVRPKKTRRDIALYFRDHVIHGPDAFAMVAHGYADYADAMRRKLLRELAVPVLGQRRRPGPEKG